MPPKFERLFKNLDDDVVFDRLLQKDVESIFIDDAYNEKLSIDTLHRIYDRVKSINEQRKSPHHRNYLLNQIHQDLWSLPRFILEKNSPEYPDLEKQFEDEINRLKKEG